MADQKDPYRVLGVPKGASTDDIRRAYRKLARLTHPDVKPGDKAAEERFKEVSHAYDILSDGKKRKLFDEFGHVGLREGFDANQARAYAHMGGMGGGRHGFGGGAGPGAGFDLGDMLGDLFGGGGMGFGGPRGRSRGRGADLTATVEIDLMEAIRGTTVSLTLPHGQAPVSVRIPAGTDEGTKMRVAGRGASGPQGPGDLILEARLRPHPFFRKEGLDLIVRLPVTVAEAFNGAQIGVPAPSGNLTLRLPARTQSGSRLRLKGKGIGRGGETGDLYAEIDIRLPDRSSPEAESAARQLDACYSEPVRCKLRL